MKTQNCKNILIDDYKLGKSEFYAIYNVCEQQVR